MRELFLQWSHHHLWSSFFLLLYSIQISIQISSTLLSNKQIIKFKTDFKTNFKPILIQNRFSTYTKNNIIQPSSKKIKRHRFQISILHVPPTFHATYQTTKINQNLNHVTKLQNQNVKKKLNYYQTTKPQTQPHRFKTYEPTSMFSESIVFVWIYNYPIC